MKILTVTTAPLLDTAQSWRTLNIANLLQRAGHDVHLIQYLEGPSNEEVQEHTFGGKNIRRSVRTLSRFMSPLGHLMELAKDNYDLVYCNAGSVPSRCILGKLKRIPLIFDMHGGLVEEFLIGNPNLTYPSKLFDLLCKKLISFVDLLVSNKIVCVSRKMIDYLHMKKQVPLEKMAYVTNGVHLDFFKPLSGQKTLMNELGIEDNFVFGYIGNLQEYQGVHKLIEAAKIVDDSKTTFVVVGSQGKMRKGNVVFVPKIHRSRVPNYYAVCDVLVLPRPSHPAMEIAAPTKFAEYAAMGKPILTTNVGDASVLVKKYNCGIVVRDNSAKSLYEGIMQFKDSSRANMLMMGRNSRQLAENEFDWNKVKYNLLKVIEEMAHNE